MDKKTPPKANRFLFFYLSTLRGAYHFLTPPYYCGKLIFALGGRFPRASARVAPFHSNQFCEIIIFFLFSFVYLLIRQPLISLSIFIYCLHTTLSVILSWNRCSTKYFWGSNFLHIHCRHNAFLTYVSPPWSFSRIRDMTLFRFFCHEKFRNCIQLPGWNTLEKWQ